MTIPVIKNKFIWLSFSGILVVLAVAAIAGYGLRPGIDFRGGTLWQISTGDSATDREALRSIIAAEGVKDVEVIANESRAEFLIRMPETPEALHQALFAKLRAQYPGIEELSFQSIGPAIGKSLRDKSIIALILVMVGISLYIAFAFRKVFQPVSSWKYGVVTLLTLLHDVAIPAGLLAYLGHIRGVEIDGNFIVALLVVMGFSVHDTIVVFDRVRENLLNDRAKSAFGDIVNRSVNQTLARSVNTSLTLILVLLALLFAGPSTLYYFILTLLVGVTTGIYSSIFVASPLLYLWQGVSGRRK